MEVFILTLGLMLLSIGGLATGALVGRPPIRSSCGPFHATRARNEVRF